jgi:hypothetical protein
MPQSASRRSFLQALGAAAAAASLVPAAPAQETEIPGLANVPKDANASEGWQPVSDRKLRVGIVGFGVCQFGAAFSFQDHPNVEVVAVSDLFPDRCAQLAQACRCARTYPSLEELVKDDQIEAVFVATDATAWKSCATANTWPAPCRPSSGRWTKRWSCSTRCRPVAGIT